MSQAKLKGMDFGEPDKHSQQSEMNWRILYENSVSHNPNERCKPLG